MKNGLDQAGPFIPAPRAITKIFILHRSLGIHRAPSLALIALLTAFRINVCIRIESRDRA